MPAVPYCMLEYSSEFTPSHIFFRAGTRGFLFILSWSLGSVMVLVPFLFQCRRCSPLDLVTKRHVAESARKEHQGEHQEYEWWHCNIPFCRIPRGEMEM